MSHEINCVHCKQVYSPENPPKILVNCSHNMCLKCLQEQILCPVDRVRVQLRRFTMTAFKTNQALLAQIEKGKQSPERLKSSRGKRSSPKKTWSSKGKQVKSSSKKVEKQDQKQSQITIIPFEEKVKEKVEEKVEEKMEEQLPAPTYQSPIKISFKSPKLERKQSFSPQKQISNFQACLLHSKKADLICLEDKVLICASCGLFGEHKHHTIVPFDSFLTQYSLLTEECFKNYEELQSREDKLNATLVQQHITALLTEKRVTEMKQIKTFSRQLNDMVKNIEKEMITNLDIAISYKKNKLVQSLSFSELISKRDEFILNVEGMTEGLESLFNLQNIEKYIPYIDSNDEHSYVLEEGEYLIRQIDNYSKTIQQRIVEDVEEFKYSFQSVEEDVFKRFISISSIDIQQIEASIEQNKKEQEKAAYNSARNRTPSRGRVCKDTTVLFGKSVQQQPQIARSHQNEDNTLLLGLDTLISSPNKQEQTISPIPFSNMLGMEASSHLLTGSEFILKGPDCLPTQISTHNTGRKSCKPPVNKSLNPSKTYRHTRLESQNQLSQSTVRPKSRTKSFNNSNNLTQRELLFVLNEKSDNKKKKKLDLPQKYAKVYDDLYKDRLQVLDLGGGFLGDNTILSICELFPFSRGKLKQVKLMNNKISDDIFAELIGRCRSVSSLNLSYNTLTERCLDWLQTEVEHLGELRNITLSNNKIVLRNNRQRIEDLKRRGLNVSL